MQPITLSKQVRQQLGLTQTQMAVLLGLKRSHYSLVEIGRRPINAHAALKLVQAWQELRHCPEMPKAPKIAVRKQDVSMHRLDMLARKLEQKAFLLQQQGLAMRFRLQQADNCQSILPVLAQKIPDTSTRKATEWGLAEAGWKQGKYAAGLPGKFLAASEILFRAGEELGRLMIDE